MCTIPLMLLLPLIHLLPSSSGRIIALPVAGINSAAGAGHEGLTAELPCNAVDTTPMGESGASTTATFACGPTTQQSSSRVRSYNDENAPRPVGSSSYDTPDTNSANSVYPYPTFVGDYPSDYSSNIAAAKKRVLFALEEHRREMMEAATGAQRLLILAVANTDNSAQLEFPLEDEFNRWEARRVSAHDAFREATFEAANLARASVPDISIIHSITEAIYAKYNGYKASGVVISSTRRLTRLAVRMRRARNGRLPHYRLLLRAFLAEYTRFNEATEVLAGIQVEIVTELLLLQTGGVAESFPTAYQHGR